FALLVLLLTSSFSQAIAQTTAAAEIFGVQLGRVHAEGFVLEQSGTVTITATCLDTRKTRPLSSNAWILDATTRMPVWDFADAASDRRGRHLREAKTDVRLGAGSYEVYYASFLDWNDFNWRDGGIGEVVRNVVDEILDRNKWDDWGDWEEKFDELRGDLGVTVRTEASVRRTSDMDALAKAFVDRAFLTISGVEDDAYGVRGFELQRPMQVDIYAIGELIDNDRYDYAWIIDTATRRKVWEMNRRNTEHAGGAKKNRMSRDRIRLDQGRYAAFYVSDGSHSTTEWNAPPPYDPDFWGVTVLATDGADLRQVSLFDYENVPLAQAFVKLREVRDDEHRIAGFRVNRPTAVRIYAMGEGRSGDMFDYGWIIDADTRQRVWTMDYSLTDHAGGASKNRLYDGVIELDAGNYEAHYITDDSHAFNEWNSDRPFDPPAWGMTIVPAEAGNANRFSTFDPRSTRNHLAQIVRVGDREETYTDFTLDRDARVRVYAIGEGTGNTMHDYGWIEDRETGQALWEMTYRMTEHAGGARKNRMVNTVVMLPAGRYRLHYKSDGSHSYEDWNASPPIDVEYYGITVSPSGR
ncbi:MAG: hypothetical protein R3282_06645, partial [Rhodothermales bacterium]|nr:hypothetical protein [Rhodothermales bacterium]